MKKQIIILILFFPILSFSQSGLDLDMLFNPAANKVLINGIGGTNFSETNNLKQMNNAAKFDFMYNFNLGKNDNNNRNRLINFSLKFSPTMWNKYNVTDTFNLKDIYFTDNKSAFFLGISRFSTANIGQDGKSKGDVANNQNFWSIYGNVSYTQYSVNSIIPTNKGFDVIHTQIGGQYGWLFDTEVADFMFNFSGFATYFHVLDNSNEDRAFEELLNSTQTLSGDYLGFGGKFIFQISHYAIHFEGRYYQPIDNFHTPPNFVPFSVSLGATIQGSIFKFGDKN